MSKPDYVYVTYIRATPQAIWQALTDRDLTPQYWGHSNVSDWQTGSSWQHVRGDGSGTADLVGTVIESAPPRRLVISWAAPDDAAMPAKVSRVAFAIDDHKDGVTRLTVTHSDLEPGSQMERGITEGWPLVLSSLKSFLETGQAVPF